jgi:poly-gamma-glutamate capsule biosynthesis protein CapA/YwtB (metallophosphatase superfamily)
VLVAAGLGAVLALAVTPGTGARPAAPPPTAAPTSGAVPADAVRATTTTAPPPPRSFTLVAAGDVLLHQRLWEQAGADAAAAGTAGLDFRPLLAGVAPLVSNADLAVCHLETPVAEPRGPTYGYPAFSVPPEIVPALVDTGFDACTTASNHAFDRGAAGIDRTLAALDAAGLRHTGSARDPAEAATTTLMPVAGADVALLSYTYGFNGIPPPNGEVWRSNPIDQARILADAASARAAGAEVVVVALHWGDEYQPEPNAQQRSLGPDLVRSPDIDLVLGHHAHVVQPIEPVDGEWVVYGMGNLVAHHGTPGAANEEGLLVRFTFTGSPHGWRVTQAEYAALLVVKPGPPIRVVDVGATLAGGTANPPLQARLQLAWERTTAAVNALGATAHGLSPVLWDDPPAGATP